MVTRLKPADDGEFVLDDAGSFVGYWEYKSLFDRHHEAQAEIARLQGEVERLKADRGIKSYTAAEKTMQSIRDTAWNDAIDAAAQSANDYDNYELEEVIRTLKRPTSEVRNDRPTQAD